MPTLNNVGLVASGKITASATNNHSKSQSQSQQQQATVAAVPPPLPTQPQATLNANGLLYPAAALSSLPPVSLKTNLNSFFVCVLSLFIVIVLLNLIFYFF